MAVVATKIHIKLYADDLRKAPLIDVARQTMHFRTPEIELLDENHKLIPGEHMALSIPLHERIERLFRGGVLPFGPHAILLNPGYEPEEYLQEFIGDDEIHIAKDAQIMLEIDSELAHSLVHLKSLAGSNPQHEVHDYKDTPRADSTEILTRHFMKKLMADPAQEEDATDIDPPEPFEYNPANYLLAEEVFTGTEGQTVRFATRRTDGKHTITLQNVDIPHALSLIATGMSATTHESGYGFDYDLLSTAFSEASENVGEYIA